MTEPKVITWIGCGDELVARTEGDWLTPELEAEARRQLHEFEREACGYDAERALYGHLGPVEGCQCYGANTPELNGRCPCRGIDLRNHNADAP